MNTDKLINSMNVVGEVRDLGAEVAKSMSPATRHRYFVAVRYGTEDGVTIDCIIKGLTKPKLQSRIQSNLLDIERGCMFALRTYDDRDWMVILRITVNLR